MKCAKPNKNGEYAAKRVSNDRGAYDASINMKRSRGSVWARAILVPMLLILVFTFTLLALQTQGAFSSDQKEETAQAISGYWIDNCASNFNGGSGTAASPYEIANGAQLALMAKKLRDDNSNYQNKFWKLVNNIDLSEHYWNVSIGVNGDDNKKFMGWFHGQGYTINGMTITSTDGNRENVGLFGFIEGRGDRSSSDNRADYFTVIESFTLTGKITTQTSGYKRCGGVVGYAYMMCCIKNIHAHVDITASGNTDEIGGICGHIEQFNTNGPTKVTVIENCTSTGTISSSKSLTCTGGIAGYANTNNDGRGTCAINRCASFMKITSTGTECDHVGGIVGHLRGGTSEDSNRRVIVTECYFAGTLTIGNPSASNSCNGVIGFYQKLYSASAWMSGNWMRTNSVLYNNGSGIWNRVTESAVGSPDSNNADCLSSADGALDFTSTNVIRPYGPTWNISSGNSFTGGGY
ncbi:MAG: hypothetical protein J5774_03055, partial [Clostridia bacterium]|nr:hypothetical protein [Clostridia bacterium]